MTATRTAPVLPRVGHISFLNCLPIYWGLQRTGGLDLVELVQDTPDRLSDALVAGELDAGPISVVEYLRHPEGLFLLPGLAVGSDGPVMSVNLVSSRPLAELDGRPVALGSTSRTSVLLAQLLLEERVGVRPTWITREPDLRAMLREADAAVLIGDAALRAALSEGADLDLTVHDLGTAWRDWTGLPMVFAVWAVRAEWFRRDPEAVRAVHRAFLDSRDLAAAHVADVAAEAARWEPFAADDLERYYRALDFGLGSRQLSGLREFARRVASRAGTEPEIPLHLLND
jgi:chorismate dehydratase